MEHRYDKELKGQHLGKKMNMLKLETGEGSVREDTQKDNGVAASKNLDHYFWLCLVTS